MSNSQSLIRIALPLDEITAFCRRNPIRKLSLFGSVLRNDFNDESDIDFLVEFEPDEKIGWDMFRMERELAEIVGRKVDFLTAGFLSQYFRQHVLDTAVRIYEKES